MRFGVLGKLAVSAALALLLLVPVAMVQALVAERRARRDEALRDITSKWGGAQTLTGPFLSVPYRTRWKDEKGVEHARTAYQQVLPEKLGVSARPAPEVRRRGIFSTVVYVSEVDVAGSFPPLDAAWFGVPREDVLVESAVLSFGVSDPRGLRAPSPLRWDDANLPFAPAAMPKCLLGAGVHAKLPPLGDGGHAFSFRLSLQGSDALFVAPAAAETTVSMRSPWRAPSFAGAFLPDRRTLGPAGFAAEWRVSQFARDVPPRFRSEEEGASAIVASLAGAAFGVRFLEPVDVYQQTTRALKYAFLFIVLTFTVFFLFEVLAALRVHPLSYLLVGFGLGVFYLLLLSLAEQAGFGLAYAISAFATSALVTAYSAAVLGARRRAALVGALLGMLYGYLYVLLRLEDQALLVGSVGLFLVLAAVMWTTRKVDWYALGEAARGTKGYPPPVP